MQALDANDDRRIIFCGERSASLSLYPDGLPNDLAAQISVLPSRRPETDLPLLVPRVIDSGWNVRIDGSAT